MNRQHPFFSPIGCLGGGLLIAGILVAVWLTGGAIFSPGPLTALAENGRPLQGFKSHAEFGADCRQCHAPFQGILAERCETCHTTVRDERAAAQGLHGRLPAAEAARCADCHQDHHGADFNPTTAALLEFNHNAIGFQLNRHLLDYSSAPLACQGCHRVPGYDFVMANCASCHAAENTAFMQDHQAAFGENCLACHDGADQTSNFDHNQTGFPLQGQHAPLACAECHSAAQAPAEASNQCAACHTAPASHLNVFDAQCETCHTPGGWTPAELPNFPAFAHTNAAFQLVNHSVDYAGQPLTCAACHALPAFTVNGPACVDCHRTHDAVFLDEHLLKYGPNCVSCHDGAGNMRNFDHAQVFVLDGRHTEAQCAACHKDSVFRGTPRECAACHAEPEVHAGVFGLKCAACHSTSAWSPAQLTEHLFPLNHGEEGEVACATCHLAKYTEYTCYGCHEHEPADTRDKHREVDLGTQLLENCAACHPSGEEEGEN